MPPDAPDRLLQKIDDFELCCRITDGCGVSFNEMLHRYYGLIRHKANQYFLVGGESDDLIQEGILGFYKACRDFQPDREASFRNFADLCITRQIITAVKTATRRKHGPLNTFISFSMQPEQTTEGEATLEEVLPGPRTSDPLLQAISSEELRSLVDFLSTELSAIESRVLALFLDGQTYEEIAVRSFGDAKTVDNALQRVRRKVKKHLVAREAGLAHVA